ALMIAAARVLVGVHYLGDVAAGLLLGGGVAVLVCIGLRVL
ncbi:MAG TPA: phosphatase PAP2 family protein, partial [Anaerolineae bacterium]|nr:phosphatase PAP2 family protein [Anaerolineae bacterium]